jgi:transposase
MMGRHNRDQGQLFYSFDLDAVVPADHLVREIAAVLDLTWVYDELAPHYPSIGRPSIDPVLMIRMLIIGYVFAVRSERALCREIQVNLAYRWFYGLSIEDKLPDHSAFSRARNERFRDSDIFRKCSSAWLRPASLPTWSVVRALPWMRALLYRASNSDCSQCPLKPNCCPRSAHRKVPRDVNEEARDVARAIARIELFAQTRRDRKKGEMLFAHLKRILQLGRLRLRGPRGAQFEFTLAAIAQNLRRFGKPIARPPPLTAGCPA